MLDESEHSEWTSAETNEHTDNDEPDKTADVDACPYDASHYVSCN